MRKGTSVEIVLEEVVGHSEAAVVEEVAVVLVDFKQKLSTFSNKKHFFTRVGCVL